MAEAAAQHLNFAISNMTHGLCLLSNEGRVILVNDKARQMFSLDRSTRVIGERAMDLLETINAGVSQQELRGLRDTFADIAATRATRSYQFAVAGGKRFELSAKPTDDDEIIVIIEDVTDKYNASLTIERMAKVDTVTGLPNRFALDRHMEHLRNSLCALEEVVAVAFIDLDDFKQVNDTLGHRYGDLVLMQAGDRLRRMMDDDAFVARWGGDEFIVVFRHANDAQSLLAQVNEMIVTLAEPYHVDGYDVVIGASAGVSRAALWEADDQALLQQADMAVYAAKQQGRNHCRLFEAEMAAHARAQRAMEMDVRAAWAARAFSLHYQPIVDIHTKQIRSFEALARWRRGDEDVSPALFVPIIENLGLVAEFGAWTIEQACRDCANWPEHVRVAVNVSASQLLGGAALDATVRRAVEAAGISPRRLELEITETVLMDAGPMARELLERIRAYGVRIALDDFGTGYSSLGYLLTCPVDKLKIDRSFVAALGKEPRATALIETVARLGSQLGMTVTAEGVENEGQEAFLEAIGGISEMQGYYYGKAAPAAQTASRAAA
ncbi:MAG: EAL domain-containing protein [Hyphomicrobiales bacterium]|nr:EAL domain-containing protein [Hyphomicrobiales bacterium]